MIDLDIEDPKIKNREEHRIIEERIYVLEKKIMEMEYIIKKITKEG